MDKFTILIVDSDEKYMSALEMKFARELGDYIDLIIITDVAYLREYFATPQTISILLINERLFSESFLKHDIATIFLLTDDAPDHENIETSYELIYKYTSANDIFHKVISDNILSKITNNKERDRTKTLMIYSPIGGSGKTVTALALCAELTRMYKKVLYINTETIQSFHYYVTNKAYLPNSFEKALGGSSDKLLDGFRKNTGYEIFDYLLPMKQSISSKSITLHQYKFLLESLIDARLYDYIVIDTSSEFITDKTRMMVFCDKTILVSGQDAISCWKINRFLDNIDFTREDQFLVVCNYYKSDEEDVLTSEMKKLKIKVCQYIDRKKPDEIDNIKQISEQIQLKTLVSLL